MPSMPVTLSPAVHAALDIEASASNLRAADYATRLIEDHLAKRGLLDEEVTEEINLARSLVDRAMHEALRIVEADEFRSSITFDTIQSVSADREWLQDYAKLVRDDPFKTGSPLKQTINQNLGYFIKKAVGGKSVVGPNGRPANVKVKGSIIQSYTPLAR
ncbi:MAG: hypothetical protein EOO77_05515 [Oxalobacteraceae bacterium]|nr:MAG: hypothetical protein EOO77_05515 [Oxalobacteraceae bacterium]